MRIQARLCTVLIGIVIGGQAYAFGHEGHEMVGAIADVLLVGTHAGGQVKAILGQESLQTAALWADCARGVDDTTLKFKLTNKYPECDPFQKTSAGRQAMIDYVTRNLDACHPAADEEVCHKQYHYADVAIEHNSYDRADHGTSDHDVVSAINAAVAKLKGDPVPAPFSFKTKKEALRVLAHLVGDIHQPLHVGAIYLDANGQAVDPDASAGFDADTKTQGGNKIMDDCDRLHGQWDTIPTNLNVAHFKAAGVAAAQLVPVTSGPETGWAQAWATESVIASHGAFQGLTIGPRKLVKKTWPVSESAGYDAAREVVQRQQLINAGARLAQLLEAVWP